ncbi:MAG TPA: WD40 repeat domain-containing protein [Bacteroidia bacterium]|jgi:WD40 repeat protein|nr:WD40 repeat domain-containing protein [Bacteroidia bacterium]HMU19348.1 WD40 repeat domain-containing protein [Bacteroidia bacterium]
MNISNPIIFNGHGSAVYCLLPKNQNVFYSGSGDHHLIEWSIETPDKGTVVAILPAGIYSFTLYNDLLFAGCGNGEVHCVNIKNTSALAKAHLHNSYVFDLFLNNHLLYAAGGDGQIIRTDLQLNKQASVHLGDFKIRKLLPHPDEQHILAGCGDGTVRIINSNTLKEEQIITAHNTGFSVNALCLTPDKKFLLTGSRDARLNVFDVQQNFKLIESIAAHNYAIYAIAFNPSGKLLATASRDKKIKIWNDDLTFISRIEEHPVGHKNSVNTLGWLSDTELITTGDDRSIMLWHLSP